MIHDKLYKINGEDKIKHHLNEMRKLVVTLYNLDKSEEVLFYIINNFKELEKNIILIESLTIHAIVSYMRVFNKGFGKKLEHVIFDNQIKSDNPQKNEISERDFHNLIKNYRNKHLAHAELFLKVVEVGAFKIDNIIAVGELCGARATVEDLAFYKNLMKLIIKAKTHTKNKYDSMRVILKDYIKDGKATISDELISLIMVKENIRTMWNLDNA